MYELRLMATDERSNPERGLETVRDGVMLMVDNTSPVISARQEADMVEVVVRDAASPIVKAEYSIDAKEWVQLVPVEGLADSREERYRLSRKDVEGRLVIFRVVDAQYNVTTADLSRSK